MKRIVWIGLVVGGLLLAGFGCSINLGNRGMSDQPGTTLGQELMDLKEARDRGVITDDEYELQRLEMLKRYRD